MPYSFRIVCGFFNISHWTYKHGRYLWDGAYSLSSLYARRLENRTICWFNYKGSTFYSVILRPSLTTAQYSTNWATGTRLNTIQMNVMMLWSAWWLVVRRIMWLVVRMVRGDWYILVWFLSEGWGTRGLFIVTVSFDQQKDTLWNSSMNQLIYFKISNVTLVTKEQLLNNNTVLLIRCGKKWEILRHFQGKLCGKKVLLCGKLCNFFKADLTFFCCPTGN